MTVNLFTIVSAKDITDRLRDELEFAIGFNVVWSSENKPFPEFPNGILSIQRIGGFSPGVDRQNAGDIVGRGSTIEAEDLAQALINEANYYQLVRGLWAELVVSGTGAYRPTSNFLSWSPAFFSESWLRNTPFTTSPSGFRWQGDRYDDAAIRPGPNGILTIAQLLAGQIEVTNVFGFINIGTVSSPRYQAMPTLSLVGFNSRTTPWVDIGNVRDAEGTNLTASASTNTFGLLQSQLVRNRFTKTTVPIIGQAGLAPYMELLGRAAANIRQNDWIGVRVGVCHTSCHSSCHGSRSRR
jgi:hypothetical protein